MPSRKSLYLESNNFGSRMFELGRLEEAKSHFQYALDSLQNDIEPIDCQRRKHGLAEATSPIQGWSRPMKSREDHIFVYSRAICLHTSFDDKYKGLYLCCVTYNLALTHHLMALKGARSSDYVTSSDLYEDSMTMLENLIKNAHSSDEHPYLTDLRVVILNNAGHIYYTDRVNFKAALQCFEAVCGIVSELEISGYRTALPEEEVDLMMTNVLLRFSVSAPMA
eukprot:CAMPEP_0119009150 /NCGR_PEP_ID=MMETSP1176-20130426/4176_1 /TAXON_ID=265551 /ORGANISM="Synedropsis recta cf, Strain CCMP1620" /LENGTH=222 /DNA_ID=CAMNT_0006961607 /DNA_START=31 /DNA_END=699 /DNA_ORIENTATION=+